MMMYSISAYLLPFETCIRQVCLSWYICIRDIQKYVTVKINDYE